MILGRLQLQLATTATKSSLLFFRNSSPNIFSSALFEHIICFRRSAAKFSSFHRSSSYSATSVNSNTMKFLPAAASSLASSLLVGYNYPSVTTAFVTPPPSRRSDSLHFFSSASSTTARFFSAVVPQDAQQQQQQSYSIQDGNNDEFGGVLTGEVLSILRSSNNGGAAFAVVKVCEEDLAPNNNAYAVANAMAAAAATETDDDVTKEDEEGEKVELASALFGKPMPQAVKKAAAANSKNGGVVGAYTE